MRVWDPYRRYQLIVILVKQVSMLDKWKYQELLICLKRQKIVLEINGL